MRMILPRHVLALLMALTVPNAHASIPPAAAGEVTLMTGQASASSEATLTMRPLQKGDAVYAGEIIASGPNTYVNLKFTDGGLVLLRPNSRFVIEDYADRSAENSAPAATATPAAAATAAATATPAPLPTGEPPKSRAFFRLLKGGFRAVSGLIGKNDPDEYRINTPVATIGIRGTDYWIILCDIACSKDPIIAGELPQGMQSAGGLLVGVIQGGVFAINEAGRRAEVTVDQHLINLPDGKQIYLPFEPRFLRVQPIPDPATLCQ